MSNKHKKSHHEHVKPIIPDVPRDPEAPRVLHNRRATDRAWNTETDLVELLPEVDFSLTAAGAVRDFLRCARLHHALLSAFQAILDKHPQYRNAREHKLLCEQADRAATEIEQMIASHADGIRLGELHTQLNVRYEALQIDKQFDPVVGLAAHVMREAFLVSERLIKTHGAELRLKLSDPAKEVKIPRSKADADHKRGPNMRQHR